MKYCNYPHCDTDTANFFVENKVYCGPHFSKIMRAKIPQKYFPMKPQRSKVLTEK